MDISKLGANNIQGLGGLDQASRKPLDNSTDTKGPSFEELLNQSAKQKAVLGSLSQTQGIKFSNHAIDRIKSRGISMGPEQMAKLEQAVSKAEQKGARETLVLMGNNALIVNIKNKTVVTAMDQNMMKENVFTNIDSTVVL